MTQHCLCYSWDTCIIAFWPVITQAYITQTIRIQCCFYRRQGIFIYEDKCWCKFKPSSNSSIFYTNYITPPHPLPQLQANFQQFIDFSARFTWTALHLLSIDLHMLPLSLLCPATRKWRGIMLYPPKFWVSVRPSVCLSVRPSVRPSAPTTILVSATPPTVLGQSFWNFTGVLRMVWRYAYCFFRILKLFFITFFPFLT